MNHRGVEGGFCASRQTQQVLSRWVTQSLVPRQDLKAPCGPCGSKAGAPTGSIAPGAAGVHSRSPVGNVDPKNTKSLMQYARNPGRAFLEKL